MSGYEWFCAYLAATGSHRQGRAWQCPAHSDASPSLSVNPGDDGITLFYCHAGCSGKDVIQALGLDWPTAMRGSAEAPDTVAARLERMPTYPPIVYRSRGGSGAHGQPVSTVHHVYVRDEVRLERLRFADGHKQVRWEHRVDRYWEYGLGGRTLESLPLYLADYIAQARALDEPIVLCESESSVDALIDAGVYATTWAGGAAAPQIDTLRQGLAGARVVWIPDNDPAGLRCSTLVINALQEACSLATVLPSEGQDARDLLTQTTPDQLRDRLVACFEPDSSQSAFDSHLQRERTRQTRQSSESQSTASGPRTREDVMAINALHRLTGQPLLEVPSQQAVPSTRRTAAAATARADDSNSHRTHTRADVMRILVDIRFDDLGPRRRVISSWLRDPDVGHLIGYQEGRIRAMAESLEHIPSIELPRAIVRALSGPRRGDERATEDRHLPALPGIRANDRPRTRKDVIVLLAAIRPDSARSESGLLARWRRDPNVLRLRGVRVQDIQRAALGMQGVSSANLPESLADIFDPPSDTAVE